MANNFFRHSVKKGNRIIDMSKGTRYEYLIKIPKPSHFPLRIKIGHRSVKKNYNKDQDGHQKHL